MTQILEILDKERLALNHKLKRKSELGQFLTPSSVAQFMASLFDESNITHPNLLDAGAGIGILTSAFLNRMVAERLSNTASVTLVEIDDVMRAKLDDTLTLLEDKLQLSSQVIPADFIEWATEALLNADGLWPGTRPGFTHAILNP